MAIAPQAAMKPDRPRVDLVVHLPGAVSAGTYGAGVLDFLVEALDAFSEASHRGEAPAHDVVLTAISGTSAGAQTALIFACSIGYRFAPARDASPTRNPFFEHWVVRNDLRDYLSTRDAPMRSLLDPTNVDLVADSVLRFGAGLERASRPWVANPLRLGVAVTNLRGLPTTYRWGNGWGELDFTRHADASCFAVGGVGSGDAPPPQAGEHALRLPAFAEDKVRDWSTLGRACVASGAFPGVFAARTLERPAAAAGGAAAPFCAVDGGVFNSNPLDMAARLVAAGGGKHRTVLLKVGSPSLRTPEGPSTANVGLGRTLAALFAAGWREASGRPDAIQQAPRPPLHGVFGIVPQRPDRPPETALAGAALGGFAGYFEQAFREHDFLLGRANARAALATELSLPADDPLFAGWTPAERSAYGLRADGARLPVIPLVGALRSGQATPGDPPPWPARPVDVDVYAGGMRRRIAYVLRRLHPPRASWLARALCTVAGWTVVPLLAWLAMRWVLARARRALSAAGQ